MDANDSGCIVVCDAGPMIHVDEFGCLGLLSDFSRCLVPDAVWVEVERVRPAALSHPGVVAEKVTVGSTDFHDEVDVLSTSLSLHTGEVAALQLAKSTPQSLLLTDDTAARLAARQLGVRVHGTIGILIRAIRRSQMPKEAVVETLRSLPDHSTLHIKRSLLAQIIEDVERDT
jgi:predicted nucleic acid-binding protein